MWRTLGKLGSDSRGAVAPTVALSLFALIASGGIAFDYARIAAMDTELQDAADQAALAAATQLDRTADSQTHATAAIQDGTVSNRLAANLTKFANDSSQNGLSVEIDTIIFCSAFDDTKPDTATMLVASGGPCTQATNGTDSYYVIVRTSARTAKYALTPIVAAFSGTSRAMAVAGVQSSVCNIAPLFVCTTDMNFPTDADVGKGLLMKTGGGNSWAPGNYGLLDFGGTGPGGNTAVINALMGHGLNGCLATNEVETEPGNKNITDAINTRMDVYDGSPLTKDPTACNVATGAGCPAPNVRKDMIVKRVVEDKNSNSSTPPPAAACPADPKAAGDEFAEAAAPVKGFQRDTCHYSSCTGGNFGNGVWDSVAFMAENHPGTLIGAVPDLNSNGKISRYEVYKWEEADATRLAPKATVTTESTEKQNGKWDHKVTTQCSYSQPKFGSTAYPAQKDRRILPIVAANCDLLNGAGNIGSDFKLIRVFDVLLTEPSLARTSYPGPTDVKEIYGEVVGPAETFAAGSGLQYYSRNKPYLVR